MTQQTAVVRGQLAENLAANHLESLGYTILTRNYRCKEGEIDFIAQENNVLCFIEVRSCHNDEHGLPLETITPKKIRRIIRAAQHFLNNTKLVWPKEMRFDAVGILLNDPPEITLLRAAFEA